MRYSLVNNKKQSLESEIEFRSRSASLTRSKNAELKNSPQPPIRFIDVQPQLTFKVPESPTSRFSKLRISSNFNESTCIANSKIHNSPPLINNTVSPRTPRRACKDDALAKILNCFENLSTSHEMLKNHIPVSKPITKRQSNRDLSSSKISVPFVSIEKLNESSFSDSTSDQSSYSSPSDSDSTNESDELYEITRHSRQRSIVKKRPTQLPVSNPVLLPKRRDGAVKPETLNSKLLGSRVPDCLPCREDEFDAVFEFLIERLQSRTGGCMYISGVPGTGKTATVTAVLKSMSSYTKASGHDVIPEFTFISINGMHVSEPRQAYLQIYEALFGVKVAANRAMGLLEAEFCAPLRMKKTTKSSDLPPCVLLIDELDLLCSKRQDVLYSLFDWPCRQSGRRPLIVLAIANTMDLPERILHHRVASRLGLNRLPFSPYTHEQLAEIVRSHLGPTLSCSFVSKAIELATRKVAAVSGDARRALDICRRAAELAQLEDQNKRKKNPDNTVTMEHINIALKEMFSSLKLTALRSVSNYEKLFLRSLVAECSARTSEEVRLDRCIEQVYALCALEGFPRPTDTQIFAMCAALGAYKLILVEPSRRDTNMLIRLNCSQSDVLFALKTTD